MRIISESKDSLAGVTARLDTLDISSPWVWGPVLAFQTASIFAYDLARHPLTSEQAWVLIVVAMAAYWLIYPVFVVASRMLKKPGRWKFLAFGFTALGLGRGLLTEAALHDSFDATLEDFLVRLPGDLSMGLLTLVAISELTHSTHRHIAAINNLNLATDQLKVNRERAKQQAEQTESNLREMAEVALVTELERIKQRLRGSKKWSEIRGVADQIRDLIGNEVRPLSHRLRNRLNEFGQTKELPKLRKPIRLAFPRNLDAAKDTRFLAIYLLSMPNILLTANALGGPVLGALGILASFAVLPLSEYLGRYFFRLKPRSMFANWALMLLVMTISYLPLQVLIVIFAMRDSDLYVLLQTGLGVYLFTGTVVGLWQAIERNRSDLEAQLELMNHELKRETALVEQQVWLAQKKWAYLIHGTVQGALTVAASRLQLSDEQHPADVQRILADLDQAARALQGEALDELSFAQQSKDIHDTWAGVLDIEVSVSNAARAAMLHPVTARCAAELLKELAGNAYRHGKARRLYFVVDLDQQGDLAISASNDGEGLGDSARSGLGSQLYDDLTMEWGFAQDSSGVTFTAKLPAI
ncbi:MAG: hypothetical protein RL068_1028, partial [Actinomycetota bacterium]